MAWAQLAQAGLAFAGNLFGASQANKAADKAMTKSHIFQQELAQQAQGFQVDLADKQNSMVSGINSRIEAHNAQERIRSIESGPITSLVSGSIDFGALVRDAEAAGFNPLTVLRAGGMAGYSNSYSAQTGYTPSYMTFHEYGAIPNGPAVMQAAAAAPVVNGWSDATNAALGAWNAYDPYKAERGQLELGLARAQIANLGSDTAANNRRFTIPTWTGSGFKTTTGGFGGMVQSALASTSATGSKSGSSGADGRPKAFEAGDVKVTNPWHPSTGISVNPKRADAEAMETRYAETIAEIHGIGSYLSDTMYNPGATVTIRPGSIAANIRDRYLSMAKSWEAKASGNAAVSGGPSMW